MNEKLLKLLYKKFNHSNRPWRLRKIDLSQNELLHWFKTLDSPHAQNHKDPSLKLRSEVQNKILKRMWAFLKFYHFRAVSLKPLLILKDLIIERLNLGNSINISQIQNAQRTQIKRSNFLKNDENHWLERLKVCRIQ